MKYLFSRFTTGLPLTFKSRKSRLPTFEIWKSHWIFLEVPLFSVIWSRYGGLSNKHIYFFVLYNAFLLLIAYNATQGCLVSPELSCSQPRWGRESWLLCFASLPGVSWLLCGSSSWCHRFVCSLWLWYYLIILTIFDAHVVWSWTAVWSAEHRIFINIPITHNMLSLNVTCIHIHVIDR